MGRLIRGLLVSMFKNKLLYVGIASMLIYNIISEILRFTVEFVIVDWIYYNDAIKDQAMALVIIWGAICPFIAGEDFNGGMIRNKIIAGYSKRKIFLSSLIVSIIGMCIFVTLDILSVAGGITIHHLSDIAVGSFNAESIRGLLTTIWYMFATGFAVTCISCSILMLSGNRAISLVAFFILSFAVLSASSMTRMRLEEPKMLPEFEGGVVVRTIPNEAFLEEDSILRKVYQTADYIYYFNEPIGYMSYSNEMLSVTHDLEDSAEWAEEEFLNFDSNPFNTVAFDTNYCIGYMCFGTLVALFGAFRFKYCNLK